jgi:hypothetical protein
VRGVTLAAKNSIQIPEGFPPRACEGIFTAAISSIGNARSPRAREAMVRLIFLAVSAHGVPRARVRGHNRTIPATDGPGIALCNAYGVVKSLMVAKRPQI